jgi:hypothetical protein
MQKAKMALSSAVRLVFTFNFLAYHVIAFPSGAGGCDGDGPAVQEPHFSRPGGRGALEEFGYTLSVDGIVVDGTATVSAGVPHTLTVSGGENVYRGILFRLENIDGTDATPFLNTVDGDGNTQLAAVCTTPIAGVTHTNNDDKNNLSAILDVDNAASFILDLTLVLSYVDSDSTFYYTQYQIDVTSPTDITTAAPTAVPAPVEITTAPTSVPVPVESTAAPTAAVPAPVNAIAAPPAIVPPTDGTIVTVTPATPVPSRVPSVAPTPPVISTVVPVPVERTAVPTAAVPAPFESTSSPAAAVPAPVNATAAPPAIVPPTDGTNVTVTPATPVPSRVPSVAPTPPVRSASPATTASETPTLLSSLAPTSNAPSSAPFVATASPTVTRTTTVVDTVRVALPGVDELSPAAVAIFLSTITNWFETYFNGLPVEETNTTTTRRYHRQLAFGDGVDGHSNFSTRLRFVSQSTPSTTTPVTTTITYDQDLSYVEESTTDPISPEYLAVMPYQDVEANTELRSRLQNANMNVFRNLESEIPVPQVGETRGDGGLSTGAIAGIAVGGAIGLAILTLFVSRGFHKDDDDYDNGERRRQGNVWNDNDVLSHEETDSRPPTSFNISQSDDVSTIQNPIRSSGGLVSQSDAEYGDQR